MDVSDRSLQAKLTQKAKITSACSLSEVIFAFGGFINALNPSASALGFNFFPPAAAGSGERRRREHARDGVGVHAGKAQ